MHQSDKTSSVGKIAIITVAGVILVGLGFGAGMQYQKSHTKTAANSQGNGGYGMMNGGRTFGGNRGNRGSFGEVTAISSSSITVKNNRSGESKTYKITSSTTATDNGETTEVSSIKVGDTVIIRPDSSDTSTASQIIANPSLPGGGQPGGNQSQSTQGSGNI